MWTHGTSKSYLWTSCHASSAPILYTWEVAGQLTHTIVHHLWCYHTSVAKATGHPPVCRPNCSSPLRHATMSLFQCVLRKEFAWIVDVKCNSTDNGLQVQVKEHVKRSYTFTINNTQLIFISMHLEMHLLSWTKCIFVVSFEVYSELFYKAHEVRNWRTVAFHKSMVYLSCVSITIASDLVQLSMIFMLLSLLPLLFFTLPSLSSSSVFRRCVSCSGWHNWWQL